MKIVVDECLPRRLCPALIGHDAKTVPEIGFSGYTNGKLLAAISELGDVFVTIDGNLQYQQNLSAIGFGIVVIASKSNRLQSLEPMIPDVLDAISRISNGEIITVHP